MSFGAHTPEALLSRSDSKNPATTCKGLTSAGRPCRRALAAGAVNSSSLLSTRQDNGVVAILDAGEAAAFFCYQHKEQAEHLVANLQRRARVLPLKQKNSVDTLMERVGVLDLKDKVDVWIEETDIPAPLITAKHPYRQNGLRMRDTLPEEWQKLVNPLMSLPEDVMESSSSSSSDDLKKDLEPVHQERPVTRQPAPRPAPRSNPKPKPKPKPKSSWSCCASADDEDLPPPRRAQMRSVEPQPSPRPTSSTSRSSSTYSNSPSTNPSTSFSTSPSTKYAPSIAPSVAPSVAPSAMTTKTDMTSMTGITTMVGRARSFKIQSRQNMAPAVPSRRRPNSMGPDAYSRPATQVFYPTLHELPDEALATPTRPVLRQAMSNSPPNSQTAALLSLIPDHLSPTTTSALLAELSKPVSASDEVGYIYMFWLTPESEPSRPDDDTATSLLEVDDVDQSPDASPTVGLKRYKSVRKGQLTAQALQRFSSVKRTSAQGEEKKIMLKIGRASNVHRRLSQWAKQCGQNITLIRFYPYQSRESRDALISNGAVLSQTVPHVNKVERLIHLELADQRASDKGKCDQCGREHREWFEVDATREGVRSVDAVIRRWVSWAERQ